jgi:hypothetical protein
VGAPFPLGGGILQDQEQQLRGGVIGWEVPACSDGAAQLRIRAFNGVCGVNNPPRRLGEGEGRDDLFPLGCRTPSLHVRATQYQRRSINRCMHSAPMGEGILQSETEPRAMEIPRVFMNRLFGHA